MPKVGKIMKGPKGDTNSMGAPDKGEKVNRGGFRKPRVVERTVDDWRPSSVEDFTDEEL